LQGITDKYRSIVTQTGGEILAVEKWDRRRLAYEVAGKREGIYILMYFRGEAAVAAELDRVMKLSEDVMRHLIVRDEVGQAAQAQERASRPSSRPAERPQEAPAAEATSEVETAVEETPEAAPAEETAVPTEETTEAPVVEEPTAEAPAEPAEAAEPAETAEQSAEEQQAE
jgi:small subunit ribosomal protein S6